MALPPVPNARVGSDPQRAQDAAQQAVRAAFANLARACPLLDGVPVGPVRLAQTYDKDGAASPADTTFKHSLGRAAKGWIVVDATGPAHLWRSDAANKLPDSTLVLSHDAAVPVLVSLWVF